MDTQQTPSEDDAARKAREADARAAAERLDALSDVLRERMHQIARGHTPEADGQLTLGELSAAAAACIAVADDAGEEGRAFAERFWPWGWQQITTFALGRRKLLTMAAALLLAELERLPRADDSADPQTLTIKKGGN